MKFSERWLRTLVDPTIDTATLCDKLTMGGFEVEDVTIAAPPFANVVVGAITNTRIMLLIVLPERSRTRPRPWQDGQEQRRAPMTLMVLRSW